MYAEVDLEIKARALETCEIKGERGRKAWRQNAGVMEFKSISRLRRKLIGWAPAAPDTL
jgi:hypothetical protein